MFYRFLLFLLFNFGALAIGGMFTGEGVPSDWYVGLNKAPWTPPGWVFGVAWTLIMLCFSLYMTSLWSLVNNHKRLLILYVVQLILNIIWNPIFFYFHNVSYGFLVIILLTILVFMFLFQYKYKLGSKTLLILPYAIWLIIATSLNGYVLIMN